MVVCVAVINVGVVTSVRIPLNGRAVTVLSLLYVMNSLESS
jgi:hypothetical protein